jgi:hypothetical protein
MGIQSAQPTGILPLFIKATFIEERRMAKGQDAKKSVKKKPEKNLKEKRAEKKEKKANRR